MDSQRSAELLRSWHLAVLRFAVTRENADKLGVLAAANEIDGLSRQKEDTTGFEFFRKTSLDLCDAVLARREAAEEILRQYVAQIDDVRLARTLAAALEINLTLSAPDKKRSKPARSLWRGLTSQGRNLSRPTRPR
jgi:hypothetical protein